MGAVKNMKREEFVKKAVRAAERKLKIPSGWWGTFADVHGPRGIHVKFSASRTCWVIYQHGDRVSLHDSRDWAILKAKKLIGG